MNDFDDIPAPDLDLDDKPPSAPDPIAHVHSGNLYVVPGLSGSFGVGYVDVTFYVCRECGNVYAPMDQVRDAYKGRP